ncbi:MAG: 2-dehydropantoate 2-reductase [Saprospiraceae bacterium]
MKIAISGIGGLGGFFGGLLASRYESSDDIEIIFIAKGDNAKAIQKNGLQLLTSNGNFTAYPSLTTSDTNKIGIVDLLMCCTKRYDLEDNLKQCYPCIDERTIILPLLNGVDTREFILNLLPGNKVLDGCAYIVARLTDPGVVMETGNISRLFFGLENNEDPRLLIFLDIFQKAGIEAILSDNIRQVIWEKYAFISPIATLTSYRDCSIGDILADAEKKNLLHALLSELKTIAEKNKITLPKNLYQMTIDRMAALPGDSTSSMHSDFKKGKLTELESLSGYIMRQAEKYKLLTPTYSLMYNSLKIR